MKIKILKKYKDVLINNLGLLHNFWEFFLPKMSFAQVIAVLNMYKNGMSWKWSNIFFTHPDPTDTTEHNPKEHTQCVQESSNTKVLNIFIMGTVDCSFLMTSFLYPSNKFYNKLNKNFWQGNKLSMTAMTKNGSSPFSGYTSFLHYTFSPINVKKIRTYKLYILILTMSHVVCQIPNTAWKLWLM